MNFADLGLVRVGGCPLSPCLKPVPRSPKVLEYVGKGKSIVDVGLAQARRPLSPRSHYFELEILDPGEKCYIALGVARKVRGGARNWGARGLEWVETPTELGVGQGSGGRGSKMRVRGLQGERKGAGASSWLRKVGRGLIFGVRGGWAERWERVKNESLGGQIVVPRFGGLAPYIALISLPCVLPPRITPKIVTLAGAGAQWPIMRVSPQKWGGPPKWVVPPQTQDPNSWTSSYSSFS